MPNKSVFSLTEIESWRTRGVRVGEPSGQHLLHTIGSSDMCASGVTDRAIGVLFPLPETVCKTFCNGDCSI